MVDFPTAQFFLDLFGSTPVVLFLAILGGRNGDHFFFLSTSWYITYVTMSVFLVTLCQVFLTHSEFCWLFDAYACFLVVNSCYRAWGGALCLNSLGFDHCVNLLSSIYHMVIPRVSTYDFLHPSMICGPFSMGGGSSGTPRAYWLPQIITIYHTSHLGLIWVREVVFSYSTILYHLCQPSTVSISLDIGRTVDLMTVPESPWITRSDWYVICHLTTQSLSSTPTWKWLGPDFLYGCIWCVWPHLRHSIS